MKFKNGDCTRRRVIVIYIVSQIIIIAMKSKKWAEHSARMGAMRNEHIYRCLIAKSGRRHEIRETQGAEGRVILE